MATYRVLVKHTAQAHSDLAQNDVVEALTSPKLIMCFLVDAKRVSCLCVLRRERAIPCSPENFGLLVLMIS